MPVKKQGFTLVELILAISIAGFVISGVVVTSAELVKRTADPMLAVQRMQIVQAYLDEIAVQTFEISIALCPVAGNREDYTHMCQYRAISNTQVTDQFGTIPPGLTGYLATVTVSSDSIGPSNLGPAGNKTPAADTALVSVSVASPDGATTVLSGYVVRGT